MHSIPAQKSYTHQNSSTTSSECKGSTQSTKQPTLYYTLHHGIWHSVITATRDSFTCQPETCSSQQYPSRERTSPLSFRNLGPPSQPCLANSNQTHCLLHQHITGYACSKCFYKQTGTSIYCKTSSLAFLSWCPPVTLKMMQSLHGVVYTHKKKGCLPFNVHSACA